MNKKYILGLMFVVISGFTTTLDTNCIHHMSIEVSNIDMQIAKLHNIIKTSIEQHDNIFKNIVKEKDCFQICGITNPRFIEPQPLVIYCENGWFIVHFMNDSWQEISSILYNTYEESGIEKINNINGWENMLRSLDRYNNIDC